MFGRGHQQNSNFHGNANNILNAAQQNINNNRVKVSFNGWQNASPSDCINFVSRKTNIAVKDSHQEGQLLVGYVDSPAIAKQLLTWSGVRFASNSLKINIIGQPGGSTTVTGSTMSNNVAIFTNFFYTRYNAQMKMLNLSALQQDQTLISSGIFNMLSTPAKLYPAIMKIALNEKKKGVIVETVDLSSNNLRDVFCLNTLYEAYPDLLNLSLANNQIEKLTSLEQWKGKFKKLRELIMVNNKVTMDSQYKNIVLKIFPKLILLDSVMIRDEMKLKNIYEIQGFPQQQFFFETNDVGQYASGFVSNFLNLWDTNRQQLLSLYTDQSQFSLSTDTSIPPSTVEDSDQSPAFGYYTSLNRNTVKVSTEKLKEQRLCIGQQQIGELFRSIPLTKHTLLETPELYSVQAVTYSAVNGFIITLHGSFDEVGKPEKDTSSSSSSQNNRRGYNNRSRRYNTSSGQTSSESNKLAKKSFDRTWVVIPQNGSVVIASDLLTIRGYVKGSWIPKTPEPVIQTPNPALSGAPAAPGLVGQPPQMGTPAAPQLAPTLQLPPDVMSKLTPVQLQLINRVHMETKLNAQFAYMLCEQSGWQYDVAMKGFQSSMHNIPRDAFVM
ncbi:hypothetical protein ACO0QE_002360 [Hanseniaspora vineae]